MKVSHLPDRIMIQLHCKFDERDDSNKDRHVFLSFLGPFWLKINEDIQRKLRRGKQSSYSRHPDFFLQKQEK